MPRKQREQLPENYGMTIGEINGRFYPLRFEVNTQEECILLHYIPQFRWDIEDDLSIPPAIGPRRRTGIVSFPTYRRAVDFCHRRHEEAIVIIDAERLAAGREVYPERNAWYLDEIEKLVGGRPLVWHGYEAYAWVGALDGEHFSVHAPTPDEAIESLYETLAACARERLYTILATCENESVEEPQPAAM